MIENVIDSLDCGFYMILDSVELTSAHTWTHTFFLEVTNRINGSHTFDFINSVQKMN